MKQEVPDINKKTLTEIHEDWQRHFSESAPTFEDWLMSFEDDEPWNDYTRIWTYVNTEEGQQTFKELTGYEIPEEYLDEQEETQ